MSRSKMASLQRSGIAIFLQITDTDHKFINRNGQNILPIIKCYTLNIRVRKNYQFVLLAFNQALV